MNIIFYGNKNSSDYKMLMRELDFMQYQPDAMAASLRLNRDVNKGIGKCNGEDLLVVKILKEERLFVNSLSFIAKLNIKFEDHNIPSELIRMISRSELFAVPIFWKLKGSIKCIPSLVAC